MSRTHGPVSWAEARELVIGILVAVVLSRVAAGVVRAIDADNLDARERFIVFTSALGVLEGLVLGAATVLLITAPHRTVPAFLRQWIFRIAVVLGLFAFVGAVNILTLQNGQGGAGKLYSVLQVGLPATALFALCAWLAREVATLPTD